MESFYPASSWFSAWCLVYVPFVYVPYSYYPGSLTDTVAMDCEMVGVSSLGNKSALGRVTLVLFPCSAFLIRSTMQWIFQTLMPWSMYRFRLLSCALCHCRVSSSGLGSMMYIHRLISCSLVLCFHLTYVSWHDVDTHYSFGYWINVSVWQVNKWGNVVYDEYVRPLEYVVDFRTEISGIRPRDLKKGRYFIFCNQLFKFCIVSTLVEYFSSCF